MEVGCLRIRLAVSDDSYEEVRRILMEKGIEIDDDAEFVLTQQERYIGHLAVKQPESGERLHIAVEDIVFIESFGHTVEVYTKDEVFHTSDRLYQLLNVLDPSKFIRVSNSVIIAKRKVKKINPSFSMKFMLVMVNGRKIDVTRSYYNSFRDAFNI